VTSESEIATVLAAVSFERTPLLEISHKVAAIEALGWQEYDRLPHRWIVKYEKVVGRGDTPDGDELADVMGEYWVDPGTLRADYLLTYDESVSDPDA
jgi:hypothetical protein